MCNPRNGIWYFTVSPRDIRRNIQYTLFSSNQSCVDFFLFVDSFLINDIFFVKCLFFFFFIIQSRLCTDKDQNEYLKKYINLSFRILNIELIRNRNYWMFSLLYVQKYRCQLYSIQFYSCADLLPKTAIYISSDWRTISVN